MLFRKTLTITFEETYYEEVLRKGWFLWTTVIRGRS